MNKKRGLKWHIDMMSRGVKQIHQIVPRPLFLAKTLDSIFRASAPFINIWFSAQILSELAGAQNRERLIFLVLMTISLNLVAQMALNALSAWEKYCDFPKWDLFHNALTSKMLTMDYIDAENPDVRQQCAEILGHQRGMGFGFIRLLWMYENVILSALQVLLGVGFAFTMFTLPVPEGSPYAFLDSPLAVVIIILLLCCSTFLAPYLNMVGGRVWERMSDTNSLVNRLADFYFSNILINKEIAKDIRIYKQQKAILDGLDSFCDMRVFNKAARFHGRYFASHSMITHFVNGGIFLYIAMKAYAGAFDVGSILLYVGAIHQFGGGFSRLMSCLGEIANNNPFIEKAFAFLDIPNNKYLGTIPIEKRDDNDYAIEFRNVSFKYPNSDTYALRNLNMTLHIGQRLAVVGMNGSGKTTMIKLLTRLYDPTEGEITLNGIDIKKYNYDEYMAIFGVVFQDFALLPFTLGQNVATSVKYDENRVRHVLGQANFGDRLSTLPHGLDTYLGKEFEETGVEMSGGEQQKIVLARALYKNAPFIVLDEPTAALDPIAEYEIYSAFNEIVGDKTAIYISHRLSSCRFCDDIAVFHEGQLIQRGNHESLLSDATGKYHELWHAQAQYYTE
ncbi:MAG: ABC transporter ATP-binding protein/permease [Defluviitaleaceae bacterium]|nr:ABC transporter ATP-binding protein/permease [Defluviitaleaceae bacterium]MCL2275726.1 ABC transporter ATP-binding protein/permease [Defluviitaleaceae bacterium]